MGFTVSSVEKGSAAWRSGIRQGDEILSFDSETFLDYIDYIDFASRDALCIQYLSRGKQKTAHIRKDADEPLGVDFAEGLLGRKRVCGNHCLFCFVDQLPAGMRESLYVKDEDWRYSFIMGNYVTLSNVSDAELARILRRKASPLYISVHATDENKRKTLLGNPKARPIRPALETLAEGGIKFHTQAVLCKGLNGGEVFRETMEYLYGLWPAVMTLAAVPCGLTAHRQGLPALEPTDRDSARETIRDVEAFQQRALREKGTRFVFASDEMYIKAALQPPAYETYEEFPQIENGVGLIRKFEREVLEALEDCRGAKPRYKSVSVATGTDAYPYISRIFEKIGEIVLVEAAVYAVENSFFRQ